MLQFGYAQEDITPVRGIALCGYFNPRPNKGMLDPLKVKAAVFSVNKNIAGIVSYDLCFIPKALVNRFISALKDAGITFADKIIFCATHTHTGPYTTKCFDDMSDAAYLDALVAKTVYAVKNAFASLAPAEIQATVTECTTQAYNRRFWMKDGSVLTNPGKLNPNIDRPEGAMDPEIPIIAIKQEGQLRALIVNIVNHTDTIGGDFISADWPGRMEHAIQSELGYDIPVITIVGAQGNINHFNVKTAVDQTSYQEAIRIGKAYASVILSALYQLNTIAIDKIRVASEEFEVPYR
ncbi:MAG: neutral/alkaline non-lysosomal ceramidase N-terminal domain-containing protein, partial [Victivallales bacterium]|nr:neutral/alkaline non-lysosomal ceramidase N-terminal domain-containing protein [Victivallales bacterium]